MQLQATSALDSKTEKEILAALQMLAHGRTAVFVAHRLSTAAQCDQDCGPRGGGLCVPHIHSVCMPSRHAPVQISLTLFS